MENLCCNIDIIKKKLKKRSLKSLNIWLRLEDVMAKYKLVVENAEKYSDVPLKLCLDSLDLGGNLRSRFSVGLFDNTSAWLTLKAFVQA